MAIARSEKRLREAALRRRQREAACRMRSHVRFRHPLPAATNGLSLPPLPTTALPLPPATATFARML
jgi:hypothetical protein